VFLGDRSRGSCYLDFQCFFSLTSSPHSYSEWLLNPDSRSKTDKYLNLNLLQSKFFPLDPIDQNRSEVLYSSTVT
jgi:hypothetical protein